MRRKGYKQVFKAFKVTLQQQFFKGEKLMLNKVIITGRLVADPELRYTPRTGGSNGSNRFAP